SETKLFKALVESIETVEGVHTRNTATIGGHIALASITSDIIPLLTASGCDVTIIEISGQAEIIPMDKYLIRKNTLLNGNGLILSLFIPVSVKGQCCSGYWSDVPHRQHAAASNYLNAGMVATLKDDVIHDMRLCFGGIGSNGYLNTIGQNLVGSAWNDNLLKRVFTELDQLAAASKTITDYKASMMKSFFFKFYHQVMLKKNKLFSTDVIKSTKKRAIRGKQCWQEYTQGNVGNSVVHVSAKEQVTGDAQYLDDIPPRRDELFIGLVKSTCAHANIRSIDVNAAMSIEGVVRFVDYRDVPGSNLTGCLVHDEEIFAVNKVTCVGQIIGAIVAEDRHTARKAAGLVKVVYEQLEPIITFEEAFENNSFYHPHHELNHGDVHAGFSDSDDVISDEMRMGGQEHFYMETHCCLVTPIGRNGEMSIISSTQNTSLVQRTVASAIGVSANNVVCKVTRLGGGFGGKEFRPIMVATVCAVASH
uniref:Xanthine dehydrogenase/oxidase-like n=1 Tax=Saccoglossus kowalevskii TaxID=10224 RepID=A0ABM0LV52_SACKO